MSDNDVTEHAASETELKKIGGLMKGIRFAMLTTCEPDGSLHSRPMATQDIEFNGDLWFFTSTASHKVFDVERENHVNVSFAEPENQTYVSLSGTAALVKDQAKIDELWKPVYKVYFPQGKEDPELALLKVSVQTAEYWDSPGTKIGRIYRFAKAYSTGNPREMGEHEKIRVE